MPIDLSQNISRFEADDLRQFTYIDTVSIPSCVMFAVYNTDGNVLAPVLVQSGVTVTVSGPGFYFIFRQLPTSRGFYTAEWKVYGSGTAQSSLYTVFREMFEVIKTEPVSFSTYGDKGNVLRVSRQLVGRGDLTEHDVQPHMLAAYNYINSRLTGVVTVPIPGSPAYVAQGEEVLAIYTLYGEFGANQDNEIPPSFAKLRDDFVEFIDAVVEGKAKIEGASTSGAGGVTYFNGGVQGGRPTFGRSDWEKQTIDTTITDFEADQREE